MESVRSDGRRMSLLISLKRGRQTYWQVLPMGPTCYGDSPYQSYSAFAGNPYFIDLDTLKDEKLLTQDEIDACWWCDKQDQVKYDALYYYRFPLLRKAYERSSHKESVEYQAFLEENEEWLDDYALYMAVKGKYEGKGWMDWDDGHPVPPSGGAFGIPRRAGRRNKLLEVLTV